ncbi:CD302 antigen isoform X1 [Rhinoderma darwinii]|uniref:CD302 antigen isoform X1 n=1 Tax=Rhinoderma darwinii TaxID=43563 RepID=UPI003F66FA7D
MRRMLSFLAAEVSRRQTRTTILLCLCSAVCCVSGQSVPGQGGEACLSPLWDQFNNSCYTFVYVTQKNSLSIESARKLCKDIGADIISISSKEENSFLVNMFKTKWKGLPEVLLGLFYDSDDNSLKWYDQSEVTFLNWGQVQLADNNLNTCVKMNTQSGLWDVTDCDNFTESAALCKYVPKETRTFDKKAMMITLITTFTIISLVLPIVVLLHKRRNWSNGLHRAEVLPYSDDAVLVDTMEREAYA